MKLITPGPSFSDDGPEDLTYHTGGLLHFGNLFPSIGDILLRVHYGFHTVAVVCSSSDNPR